MGKLITENSKNFIKDNFPEVSIQETDIEIIFEGRFIINARKENFEIHEAPLLRIIMNKDYPNILPVCYDLNKKIKYDHVFQNGSLCVSTLLDLAITLKDSISIQDYIDKFIIPYFLSYRYWQKTGKDLNGDRSHGTKGIFESLREYLSCNLSDEELKILLCWASKTKKFKRCIPKKLQEKFKIKYIIYVRKLRTLGINYLRLQYKNLLIILKGDKIYEMQKYFFT